MVLFVPVVVVVVVIVVIVVVVIVVVVMMVMMVIVVLVVLGKRNLVVLFFAELLDPLKRPVPTLELLVPSIYYICFVELGQEVLFLAHF